MWTTPTTFSLSRPAAEPIENSSPSPTFSASAATWSTTATSPPGVSNQAPFSSLSVSMRVSPGRRSPMTWNVAFSTRCSFLSNISLSISSRPVTRRTSGSRDSSSTRRSGTGPSAIVCGRVIWASVLPMYRFRYDSAAASADEYPLVTATTRLTDTAIASVVSNDRTRRVLKLERTSLGRTMGGGKAKVKGDGWRSPNDETRIPNQ